MKDSKERLWFTIIISAIMATLMLLVTTPVETARADGSVIYVDRDATGAATGLSWTDAYTNLQDALSAATAGDEIWGAAGVYFPTNDTDQNITFYLKSDVELYGGFDGSETRRDQRDWEAHVTVLSGDIDGNDTTDANGVSTHWSHTGGSNTYNVVTGNYANESGVLDGFTITGGSATWRNRGGGMHNNGGSPTLRNLTFCGNRDSESGGGMYNNGSPRLENVIFSGNGHNSWTINGGGMHTAGGAPLLINVTFSGNTVDQVGGGMYASGGAPVLINVTFSGNSSVDSHGGGMYTNHSDPALINVVFSGNTAGDYGGGMYVNYSNPVLINVTFSGNAANPLSNGAGGGLLVDDSAVTLRNCIFWGNTAGGEPRQIDFVVGSPSATINYSLIQEHNGVSVCSYDFVTCDHVISDNPQFAGGLRLGDNSPAIDAGDNETVPADTYDLDGDGDITEPLPYDRNGNPRFVEHPQPDTGNGTAPLVDMGAYETSVLLLEKTATPTLLEPGDPLTYVLTLKNDSTYVVTDALISDAIPAYLYDLDFDSSGVQVTPTGSISYAWEVQDLPVGQGGVITVTGILGASLLPGQSFDNVACFSGMAGGLAVDSTASATVARDGADLAVGKRAARDPVVAGERLTYTLTITNHGLFDSSNIVLTDTLPEEVTFISASPGCYEAGDHTITCTPNSLRNQATAAFTVAITAPVAVGQITNVVTVAAATPDPDPANNTATEITRISAEADLGIIKSDQPDPVLAGSLLTYTLVATNHGPDVAGGVVLSDALPPGTSYTGRLLSLPMNEPEGASHFVDVSGFGHHGTCSQYYGTCPVAGVRGLYDYVLSFDGKDNWVESADFDIGNDFTISLWIYPLSSDDNQAFISKHTSGGGDLFVLGFYNGGYHVNLRGVTYQAGTKTADDWQHLAVVGQQTSPSTTEVTVYKDGQPLWQHEFAAVVEDLAGKGWAIGQEWDGSNESDFFYGAMDEITIYNRPLSASEITALQTSHPAVSPIVSQGTCRLESGGGLACDLGALSPDTMITVTIPVQISPTQTDTLTNTATATGYVPDPLSNNNVATQTTQVSELDLALDKMANATTLFESDSVTYTITLVNHGPSAATDIVASDALPGGICFGGTIASTGVYSNASGLWHIGALDAGSAATLTVTGTVDVGTTGQTLTNTAVINASTPVDLFDLDNQANAVIAVANADLSVSKTVDTGGLVELPLGGVVTYTVVIRNDGDVLTATGAVMSDPLPAGITFGTWVAQNSATLNTRTVEWGPHDVAPHTVYTISFTAIVTDSAAFGGQAIANTAYVTATNADPAEDSDTFSIIGWFSIYLPLVLKD